MANARVAEVVGDLLERTRNLIVEHRLSYDEYRAVKQYLIDVGEAGEWPLFLDVFFESTVERIDAEDREGSDSCIEGPYYLPDMPQVPSPATMPQRADEPGDVLLLSGTVRSADGRPLPGAVVDTWQADAEGRYSGFDPTVPEGNLRAQVVCDDQGGYQIRTVVPAPYEIPKGGPTGQLLRAAGWHAWRPAHLHFMVRARDHEPLTTQLFFEGGQWLDSDVATAVKDGLVLPLHKHTDPADVAAHGLQRPFYTAGYEFRLAPQRVAQPA